MIPPQRNADFAAAMEEVLDVHRRPYAPSRPVVCMDETPRQLIGRSRPSIPAEPGRPEREDHEYRRLGTCNVFMATEPLAGRRMTKVTERRTKTDRAHFFLDDIAGSSTTSRAATLAPRGSRWSWTTSTAIVRAPSTRPFRRPGPRRCATGSTSSTPPRHGSWLNVAEIELNVMIRQCLNRRIDDIAVLRREVAAWQAARDRIRAKVDWQFTTEDARLRLKRLYPTFDE